MTRCRPCDTWSFEAMCAESITPEPIYVPALAMTSINDCVEFEIDSSGCMPRHTHRYSQAHDIGPGWNFWHMCISRRPCSCTARTATAEQTYSYNRSHITTITGAVTCTHTFADSNLTRNATRACSCIATENTAQKRRFLQNGKYPLM